MELIDGHPVVEHQIRFRLRTIIDERFADQVRDGETMVWVVRALCKPPQYYPLGKEADERYKLAVQDVEAAAPLAGEARTSAIEYLDGASDQLVLPFHGEDEATELRGHLADIGELRDGERLVDAVRRLTSAPNAVIVEELGNHTPQQPNEGEGKPPGQLEDDEYAAAVARATAVLRDAEPPQPHVLPPAALPDGEDVEVVGSIYRRGRSDLSELLQNKFGEP